MLIKTFSGAVRGLEGLIIPLEITISSDHAYSIRATYGSGVETNHARIASVLTHSGFRMPEQQRSIDVVTQERNTQHDLAVAIGILVATNQVKADKIKKYILIGTLSADGSVQATTGVLPIAIKARNEGFNGIILPKQNAREAAIVNDFEVYGAENIKDVAAFFNGDIVVVPEMVNTREAFYQNLNNYDTDFSDIEGQEHAKRALEIAAAGGHNIALLHASEIDLTALVRRLPSILPPPTLHEALEVTKIYSVAGKLSPTDALLATRPFRAPRYDISDVQLVGGGAVLRPGEVSFAHNGVLFLNELLQFKASALEVMREPLEMGSITFHRADYTVRYPANTLLVTALHYPICHTCHTMLSECTCSPHTPQTHNALLSASLRKIIDMHVELAADTAINAEQTPERSEVIRERVIAAKARQAQRFGIPAGRRTNATMSSHTVRDICVINNAGRTFLQKAIEKWELSINAHEHILKISRTIADLAGSDTIELVHLAEAIHFRSLDRVIGSTK